MPWQLPKPHWRRSPCTWRRTWVGSKIRVNAISAGAIKTLSAGGIAGFRDLLKYAEVTSPMKELVSQDDVGDLALFLASDLARRITGEVIYVDARATISWVTPM